MQIQLTPAEAQAQAELIIREVREAASRHSPDDALFRAIAMHGPIARQIIELAQAEAQAEQAAQQEEQADGND